MPIESAFRMPATASLFALVAAFAVCLTVLVFSWPDRHDRKRAIAPKLVECCEVKIGNTVLVSRRERAPVARADEAAIVPIAAR